MAAMSQATESHWHRKWFDSMMTVPAVSSLKPSAVRSAYPGMANELKGRVGSPEIRFSRNTSPDWCGSPSCKKRWNEARCCLVPFIAQVCCVSVQIGCERAKLLILTVVDSPQQEKYMGGIFLLFSSFDCDCIGGYGDTVAVV